jgi:hypothetical protein
LNSTWRGPGRGCFSLSNGQTFLLLVNTQAKRCY